MSIPPLKINKWKTFTCGLVLSMLQVQAPIYEKSQLLIKINIKKSQQRGFYLINVSQLYRLHVYLACCDGNSITMRATSICGLADQIAFELHSLLHRFTPCINMCLSLSGSGKCICSNTSFSTFVSLQTVTDLIRGVDQRIDDNRK